MNNVPHGSLDIIFKIYLIVWKHISKEIISNAHLALKYT